MTSALKLTSLNQLYSEHKDEFDNADVIGIDEAQFFNDLRTFLLFVESYNKIVIIAGLDGDFNRNPFGKIMECIPLCDEVVKLSAMDMVDNDGSLAIFSKRIAEGSETIMVGAKDKYIAVSRKNYLKYGINSSKIYVKNLKILIIKKFIYLENVVKKYKMKTLFIMMICILILIRLRKNYYNMNI